MPKNYGSKTCCCEKAKKEHITEKEDNVHVKF